MNVADQIVEYLSAQGVSVAFGVPGGAIEPLMNAISRARATHHFQFHVSANEAGAAFMANGYWRQCKRPALCVATTGPGATNLITGVMTLKEDRVPAVVITPQLPDRKNGRGGLQDSSSTGVDVLGVMAKVAKLSVEIRSAEDVQWKLAQAFAAAMTYPRGPVHISLSSDVLNSPVSGPIYEPVRVPEYLYRAEDISAVAARLVDASYPVVLLGEHAGDEARLLQRLKIRGRAVVSVANVCGLRWCDGEARGYAGVVGMGGHSEAARAIERADLVLAMGATVDELSTNNWSLPLAGKTVLVAETPVDVYRIRSLQYCQGTAKELLPALLRQGAALAADKWVRPATRFMEHKGSIHPGAVFECLNRESAPLNIWVDAGNSFAWAANVFSPTEHRTIQFSMASGTMAWSIPAAIGAAIASPGSRHCVVVGDGAFLMGGNDLGLIASLRLPITIVVMNDGGYGMVRHGQMMSGQERIGTEFPPIRFDKLAEAFGLQAKHIASGADLADVEVGNKPLLVDAVIDRTIVPPIAERVAAIAGRAA